MAPEIEALKRYRAGLLKAGRVRDAEMVKKCIALVRLAAKAANQSK